MMSSKLLGGIRKIKRGGKSKSKKGGMSYDKNIKTVTIKLQPEYMGGQNNDDPPFNNDESNNNDYDERPSEENLEEGGAPISITIDIFLLFNAA